MKTVSIAKTMILKKYVSTYTSYNSIHHDAIDTFISYIAY